MRHSIAKKSVAEREAISVHTGSLERIIPVIKSFDGKVVNKRMVDAIKAAGIYVGWGVDWQGNKEMTLHHGYSEQAREYADFKRTITVPLVIKDGRLDYAETEEAIVNLIAKLQVDYNNYAFEQEEFAHLEAQLEEKLSDISALVATAKNPYARSRLADRARRGY